METAFVGVDARKLTLEIVPGSDPINGRLGDGRESRTFSGWLELAAALQAVVDAEPDNDGNDTSSSTL